MGTKENGAGCSVFLLQDADNATLNPEIDEDPSADGNDALNYTFVEDPLLQGEEEPEENRNNRSGPVKDA